MRATICVDSNKDTCEQDKKEKLIVANWKMFGDYEFAVDYFKTLCDEMFLESNLKIIVCPPVYLINVGYRILYDYDNKQICIGAQDVSKFEKTSSTGEISASMLVDCGARVAIVGSSERRAMGETSEDIKRKIKNLNKVGIGVILCVGENEKEHLNGVAEDIINEQIKSCLTGVGKMQTLIVCYEPTWVINNDSNLTQKEISQIAQFIKDKVLEYCDVDNLFVIYGGVIDNKNMNEILKNDDIDGVLVGSFSIKTKEFCNALPKMKIK